LIGHVPNYVFTFLFDHIMYSPRLHMKGAVKPMPTSNNYHLTPAEPNYFFIRLTQNESTIQLANLGFI